MRNGFDSTAHDYDASFTFSNIGKAQREFVYKYIDPILKNEGKYSVLELNCGTGVDAVYFSNMGHEVTATDISKEMIGIAKSKQTSKNVTFEVMDINAINANTFNQKFDIVFSNFGGLNCLSKTQLKSFMDTSVDLLKPKGKLIIVLMPKQCLWERLYFSLKGNFKEAKRRCTNDYVMANVDGTSVKTWYYNPKDILSLTEHLYLFKILKPIGIAIPPSYLEHSFLTKTPIFYVLMLLETIMNQSFWAKYADHFLIELEKK